MKITHTIDWYATTSRHPEYHENMTMFFIEKERGRKGYTVVVEFEDGRVEMLNPDRPDMMVHVEYSGGALETIEQEYGVSKLEVVRLSPPQMQVTRIDLAIDIIDGQANVSKFVKLLADGKLRTSAKKFYEYRTLGEAGHTLYIGAQTSLIRARIYDKGAESGVGGDWTRVECQYRGKRAGQVRNAVIADTALSAAIPSIINRFVSFDWELWRTAIGTSSWAMPALDKAETETRKWLLKSVIPALARESIKPDGDEFLSRFNLALALEVQEGLERRQTRP